MQSFSTAACDSFRRWLAERYETIDALNAAWGNVFWSMEYRSFDAIELPNMTVTEANPAHWLAFRRFSSDQVIAFNRTQVDILRELSPGRVITHNAMGFYTGYDHYDLGADLDVLGWDSYPLGFLEMFRFSDQDKVKYARSSHPDIAAFHHDLYRGCAKDGRWSVLEQQPGPVNWARYNPAPLPGMVKLWTAEAAAHGAELVSYFRWRQFTHAQEQMHAGLLRPDGEPAPALGEAREAADALNQLGELGMPVKHVAIVFDYASEWMTQIQPQGEGLSALWAAFDCYSSVRRLGLNVDFVRPGASLDGYRLVILPCNLIVAPELVEGLEQCAAEIIIGPRTGSRDSDFAIPPKLAPGSLMQMCGLTVARSESLRPGLEHAGDGWAIARWLDHAAEGHQAEPDLVAQDGTPASYRHGRVRTLMTWPQGAILQKVVEMAARDAGLPDTPLPPDTRRRTTSKYVFEFDYPSAKFTVRSA